MVKAGLTKLNTLATNSMKTSAAKNLSSAKRAAGASYGIMAQRSNQSIFNSKAYNSGSLSSLRHQLNSRTIINNYGPKPQKADNSMGTMEKIMMYGMLGSMAAQMGIGIAGAIKDLKGSSNDGKGGTIKADKPETNLSDLNKTLQEANKKVGNFSLEYSKLKLDEGTKSELTSAIQNAKQDPDLAKYVNLLDPAKLEITELNLTESSSISEIETAITSTTTDYNNVSEFSTNLKQSVAAIGKGMEGIQGQIDAAKKADPSADTSSLQQQYDKLKALQDALSTKQETVDKLANSLQPKSEELTKLKQAKADAMDKVYDQATKDDKTIGENNAKMEKLAAKIKDAKGDKKDKLISEYNALADSNKKLQTAINNAGGNKITKGDGTTAVILNNCDKAKILHYSDNNTANQEISPQKEQPVVNQNDVNASPQVSTQSPTTTVSQQNNSNPLGNFNLGSNPSGLNSNPLNNLGLNTTTPDSLKFMQPGTYLSSAGIFKIVRHGGTNIIQDLTGKLILGSEEQQKYLQSAKRISD